MVQENNALHTDRSNLFSSPTRLRGAQYYLASLQALEEQYLIGGEAQQAACGLFTARVVQLIRIQKLVASQLEVDPLATEMACAFPNAGLNLLQLLLPPREHVRWLEDGIRAAQILGHPEKETQYLAVTGLVYGALGETHHALRCLQEACRRARLHAMPVVEAVTLANLGSLYNDLHQPSEAVSYLEQALARFRELDDRQTEAVILVNLANALDELGEKERALEFWHCALQRAREWKEQRMEGVVLGNLGVAAAYAEKWEEARVYLHESLAIARQLGDADSAQDRLGNLGFLYLRQGEVAQARHFLTESLNLARSRGNKGTETKELANLASIALDLDAPEHALAHARLGVTVARAGSDIYSEALSYLYQGRAYQAMKRVARAASCYRRTYRLGDQVGAYKLQVAALLDRGRLCYDQQDFEQAVNWFQQALALTQAHNLGQHDEYLSRMHLGAAYESFHLSEDAVEHYEHALTLARQLNDVTLTERSIAGVARTSRDVGLAYYQGQIDFQVAQHYLLQAVTAFETYDLEEAEMVREWLEACEEGIEFVNPDIEP